MLFDPEVSALCEERRGSVGIGDHLRFGIARRRTGCPRGQLPEPLRTGTLLNRLAADVRHRRERASSSRSGNIHSRRGRDTCRRSGPRSGAALDSAYTTSRVSRASADDRARWPSCGSSTASPASGHMPGRRPDAQVAVGHSSFGHAEPPGLEAPQHRGPRLADSRKPGATARTSWCRRPWLRSRPAGPPCPSRGPPSHTSRRPRRRPAPGPRASGGTRRAPRPTAPAGGAPWTSTPRRQQRRGPTRSPPRPGRAGTAAPPARPPPSSAARTAAAPGSRTVPPRRGPERHIHGPRGQTLLSLRALDRRPALRLRPAAQKLRDSRISY